MSHFDEVMQIDNFTLPSRVDHWHMAVTFKEEHCEGDAKAQPDEDVAFSAPIPLFKLERGKSKRSYGIECAKRAGVPLMQLLRAKQVLKALNESELPNVRQDLITDSYVVDLLVSTDWSSATKESIDAFLESVEPESPGPIVIQTGTSSA